MRQPPRLTQGRAPSPAHPDVSQASLTYEESERGIIKPHATPPSHSPKGRERPPSKENDSRFHNWEYTRPSGSDKQPSLGHHLAKRRPNDVASKFRFLPLGCPRSPLSMATIVSV